MCFGGGGRSAQAQKDAQKQQQANYEAQQRAAAEAEARARAEAARRAANLNTGMANINKAFAGFDDSYYNKIGSEYLDYYNPQVQKQIDDARKQMLFNASRAGTLGSSQYNENLANLDNQAQLRQNEIQSQSNARINEARNQIANQRTQQIAALNASQGDLSAGSPFLSGTISAAGPSLQPFSPIGDLFSNIAGIAANDAAIRNAQGQPGALESLFNKNKAPATGGGAGGYVQ